MGPDTQFHLTVVKQCFCFFSYLTKEKEKSYGAIQVYNPMVGHPWANVLTTYNIKPQLTFSFLRTLIPLSFSMAL